MNQVKVKIGVGYRMTAVVGNMDINGFKFQTEDGWLFHDDVSQDKAKERAIEYMKEFCNSIGLSDDEVELKEHILMTE